MSCVTQDISDEEQDAEEDDSDDSDALCDVDPAPSQYETTDVGYKAQPLAVFF